MKEQTVTGYPSFDKPWLKYYSEEAINTPLPECTMYELVFRNNQDNLDRTAIEYYGTKISYGEMFQEISYLAGTLERSGVKESDIVTICMINSPETIFLLFALNKIGAVANMVCGLNTCKELKKCIMDVNSKIVFTLDTFQDKFEQLIDEIQVEKIVVAKASQSMGNISLDDARLLGEPKKHTTAKGYAFYYMGTVFCRQGIEHKNLSQCRCTGGYYIYRGDNGRFERGDAW